MKTKTTTTTDGTSEPLDYLWSEFTRKQNMEPSSMDPLRTLTQQVHRPTKERRKEIMKIHSGIEQQEERASEEEQRAQLNFQNCS